MSFVLYSLYAKFRMIGLKYWVNICLFFLKYLTIDIFSFYSYISSLKICF